MVTTAPDIFKTTAYLLLDLPITPKINSAVVGTRATYKLTSWSWLAPTSFNLARLQILAEHLLTMSLTSGHQVKAGIPSPQLASFP